jgi:SDR family mycofactocin-dependent oxidoreductase
MGRVQGKVALITGAARGMGRSHAITLATEGADIIALDICGPIRGVTYPATTSADLDETARLVADAGGRVVPLIADVRNREELRSKVDSAVTQLGGLDIVIANAGICIVAPWDSHADSAWADTVDINLTGAWNTASVAVPHLIERGGGSVVLVSSTAGLKGAPFMAAYVASKHGVTGLARALALELAQNNIRVNSVHPSAVDTPMSSDGSLVNAITAELDKNPRLAGTMTTILPTGQLDPSDVSNAVLYLSSGESRHVTALAMAVDAGVTHY